MASGRTLRGAFIGVAVTAVAITLEAGAPAVTARLANAALQRHSPIKIHHIRDGKVSSTNWSGYAITGPAGSVTDAKASWIVPAIQGACSSTGSQYSSFWVGIDGYSDRSVEQIGTDSDCQNGVPTYYAWFEFYPHPMNLINTVAVKPGDSMSAEVVAVGKNRFTVSISDITTGRSFSTTTTVASAQRSSAEWIAEAPSSSGGVLPLADFGNAFFGQNYTPVANTSYATVSGRTGSLGSFIGANQTISSSSVVQEINMVGNDGVTLKAAPSNLSVDGSSFSVAWLNPGP